jgi:hypothetical protein
MVGYNVNSIWVGAQEQPISIPISKACVPPESDKTDTHTRSGTSSIFSMYQFVNVVVVDEI